MPHARARIQHNLGKRHLRDGPIEHGQQSLVGGRRSVSVGDQKQNQTDRGNARKAAAFSLLATRRGGGGGMRLKMPLPLDESGDVPASPLDS